MVTNTKQRKLVAHLSLHEQYIELMYKNFKFNQVKLFNTKDEFITINYATAPAVITQFVDLLTKQSDCVSLNETQLSTSRF